MLDSKSLTLFVHRMSWLLIETPARAAGFLLIVVIVILLAIKLELGQSWNLYAAAATQTVNVGDDYQLLLQNVGTAFREAGGELVVLVGGSTIRELTADDALLSKELTNRCERDVQFVNLGSSSQSFSESWDIAALAPKNRKRLILVGINPYRLGFDDDNVVAELSHNAIGVPVSFSLLWDVGLHTGFLGSPVRIIGSIARQESLGAKWKLWDLFISRQPVARRPAENPMQPDRSEYHEPVLTRAEKLRQANEYIATRVADFHERYRSGTIWYNRLFDQFNTANSDVKFLITPTDETFGKADKLIANDFRDALLRLGGESRVLDLRNQVGDWDASDFFDVQHLVAKGRAKLQPVLVETVSRALGCASRTPH